MGLPWDCTEIVQELLENCTGVSLLELRRIWIARGAPVVVELLGISSENHRSSSRVPRKLLCCCTGFARDSRGVSAGFAGKMLGSCVEVA